MPVTSRKAWAAFLSVCSGELSSGLPSLSKNEHSMHSVGISANGSRKAVLNLGSTYRSLELASMKLNRLEPSTRSPHDRIVRRYSLLLMTKFRVFNLPSPPGYMKLTMRMLFSSM